MDEPQILEEHQISKETQINNEHQILKEPQISKETQSKNEPQILNERQICKETQASNEHQISKEGPKFCKETQILKRTPNLETHTTNEPHNLKEP
jgi:hypothetical protein